MLVSIAMCTYNGEKYLEEQLDSILNQTYKDTELIICDDCSSDSTIKILNKYINKYNNIRLFENNKNIGFLKNFENAISLCSGEYILLSDQDDIWKRNKISEYLKNIENNLLIYSNAILIDKNSNESSSLLIKNEKKIIEKDNNKGLLFFNCISGNTIMFHNSLIKSILPIPKNINFHDKWISFIASSQGMIKYHNEKLTYYRRYEEQVTAKDNCKYDSLKEKIMAKEIKHLNNINKQKEEFEDMFKLDFLDEDIKKIIFIYIKHSNYYKKIFFNFELFFCLWKFRKEIFIIKKKSLIFKISSGFILNKIFLFSL